MSTSPNQLVASEPRSPALLFLLSAAWIVLTLPVARMASHLAPALWEDAVRVLLSSLLLFAGFYGIARGWIGNLRPLSAVGFVRRPGILGEFGRGAALGWGIAIALVLPAMLTGNLTLTFSFDAVAIGRFLLSLFVLVCYALTAQLMLAGLPVRLLQLAVGSSWTTVAFILLAASVVVAGPQGEGSSLLFAGLAAALFCTAFLRTRAIWLALGLQIGWSASLQLIFGASSPYTPVTYGTVQSDTGGPAWLTGGPFGPEASLFAILVLIVAMIVLVRITRDYAWYYTYQPIVGAGYPVDVPPPAEHAREEQRAAAIVPLVQIGGLGSSLGGNPPPPRIDPLP